MPNRSIRWSINLLGWGLGSVLSAALALAANSGDGYLVLPAPAPGSEPAEPEVVVVPWSAPAPVYEVVIAPEDIPILSGEERVFALIMSHPYADSCLPGDACYLEIAPGTPGPRLDPPPSVGSRREVIEF